MDFLKNILDFVLHIDQHLAEFVSNYGTWTYALLFLIVFCETGLVVMPFLPGDSLLFAAGAIAASTGKLSPWTIGILLICAAIIGDNLNYWVGRKLGVKMVEKGKYFKREHLERTNTFYERHGGKTVFLARFLPILRTFAPFVAGIGHMEYRRFLFFSVFGAIVWVSSFVGLGFFFGNHPAVKKNFSYVIIGILVISVLPAVFEFIRQRREARKSA